jgi:hypothetical protein
LAVIVECARRAAGVLGLSSVPDVRVTARFVTPFTLGASRPTLVLPRGLCVPGARLDAVLLHELAHLERRDHFWIWLERLVTTVFFFWPPVHWVSQKLDEARELACDERAIQSGGFSAVEYGRHLVDVVAQGREWLALERRIERLLQEAWLRRCAWLEALCLSLLALGLLLGIRPEQELGPPAAVATASAGDEPASADTPGRGLDDHQSLDDLQGLDGLDMSIEPSDVQPCVLQSCGTQCVP